MNNCEGGLQGCPEGAEEEAGGGGGGFQLLICACSGSTAATMCLHDGAVARIDSGLSRRRARRGRHDGPVQFLRTGPVPERNKSGEALRTPAQMAFMGKFSALSEGGERVCGHLLDRM